MRNARTGQGKTDMETRRRGDTETERNGHLRNVDVLPSPILL